MRLFNRPLLGPEITNGFFSNCVPVSVRQQYTILIIYLHSQLLGRQACRLVFSPQRDCAMQIDDDLTL